MASQDQVKRDVLRVLSDRSRIQGRNPIGALCKAIGAQGIPGRNLVEMAVRDLTNEGRAHMKFDGFGRVTGIYHSSPRLHVDRTELSERAKSERTWAKGVPAYLPDEWCGPVIVSHRDNVPVAPTTSESEAVMADLVYVKGEPYEVTLTNCLLALRERADQSGEGRNLSVRAVLMNRMAMTSSQAYRAMDHLYGMGLYITQPSGFQKRTYVVELTTPAVTREMVEQYRRTLRKPAPQDAEPITANDDSVQIIEAAEDPADVIDRLVDVVEMLEAASTEQKALVESLQAEVASLREQATIAAIYTEELESQRDQLSEGVKELRDQVANLQQEAARQPQLSGRAAQVLNRYRPAGQA